MVIKLTTNMILVGQLIEDAVYPSNTQRYLPSAVKPRSISLFIHDACIHSIVPVSYTHLDVYKRQILDIEVSVLV